MAGQATIGNGTSPYAAAEARRPEGVIEGVGSFAGNLASLAALQARLAQHDARESLSRSGPAIGALLAAALLIPAAVTLALFGFSLWLATVLNWSAGLTMLAVALAVLVASALAIFFGVRGVKAGAKVFERSREELERNVGWVKTVLAYSGR